MAETAVDIATLTERLKALDERLTRHEAGQERDRQQGMIAAEQAKAEIDRRLSDLSELRHQAKEDVDHRLEGMNALRSQIERERGDFVTRDRLDASLKALEARIEAVNNTLAALERKQANQEGRYWALGVGLSIFLIILQFASRYVVRP